MQDVESKIKRTGKEAITLGASVKVINIFYVRCKGTMELESKIFLDSEEPPVDIVQFGQLYRHSFRNIDAFTIS